MVHPDGKSILMTPSGRVLMPDDFWFPDVEAPLRALHDELGVDGYVLACLDDDREAQRVDYLIVGSAAGADWVTDVDDPLVKAARLHLDLPADHPVTPAWTKPGWYDEALAWIDDRLTAAGSPLTGVPTQVRSWGLSNVLRCPTAAGAAYFKALAHTSTITPARPDSLPLLFAHEPRLLRHLSDERPGEVVSPVAIDEDRVWMLLPDLGTPLAAETDIEVWIAAMRGHARLQRSYASSPDRLLEFGCVDRRLTILDKEIDRLFGPNLVSDQLEQAERDNLLSQADRLREAITELADIGVPETLLHGDLHPGNLAVRDGQVLAFDWTDAALSHPFLDLVTFFDKRIDLSRDPRVVDAYLSEWAEFASPESLRQALLLAEQLGALHQLMTSLYLHDYVGEASQESMLRGGLYWARRLLEQ
ncbi:phosphotransferase family enzyme [Kribbella voronezhensis]|uniref:Phosphotransferase family enzyme n=1 Tax=Kribbella voronezhensis TaxID=2512212 RepID=A0A4R7TGR2_9ACTN|nr:phosphotransferase family enzyme [Kribbella voronezhensis]